MSGLRPERKIYKLTDMAKPASQLGVSLEEIISDAFEAWLTKHGFTDNPMGEAELDAFLELPRKTRRSVYAKPLAELLKLLREGWRMKDALRQTGLPYHAVSNARAYSEEFDRMVREALGKE